MGQGQVRPLGLPLLVAAQMLLGRLVALECGRSPVELLVRWRITDKREPVSDRPIDLGVPELLPALGRRPAEELADSFPGQAERGDHTGDAGADGALGIHDYQADAQE